MKKLINLGTIAVLALSFSLVSCEKALNDASETADSGQDFSEDMVSITNSMDMVQDIGLNQSFMQKNGNSIFPESVFIYTDTSFTDGNGIEISLDFGTGTLCGDGWTRRGTLTFTANKPFSEVGSKIEIFNDIDNGGAMYAKKGTQALRMLIDKNLGHYFTLERTSATEIKFMGDFSYDSGTFEDLTKINHGFTGTYTLNQTAGMSTSSDKTDDIWDLSGTANMVNRNDTPYEVKITEKLERKSDETCSKTFTKGKLELQNEGVSSKLKLDFGDGTCDNEIEITLPGGIKTKYKVK